MTLIQIYIIFVNKSFQMSRRQNSEMRFTSKEPPLSSNVNTRTSSYQRNPTPPLNFNKTNSNKMSRKDMQKIYTKIESKKQPFVDRQRPQSGFKSFHKYQRKQVPLVRPSDAVRRYQKVEIDEKNVFYEDSMEVFQLQVITAAKPILIKLFAVLLLFYLLLTYVTPYQGYCPNNADCGAYINCHPGYQLHGQHCKISQQVIKGAQNICIMEIKNLKYQYGNTNCQESGENNMIFTPTEKITDIVKRRELEDNKALLGQVYTWLHNQQNQQQHKFKVRDGEIIPYEKQYTLRCWLIILSRKQGTQYALLAFVVVLVLLAYFIHLKRLKNKAAEIYRYLEKEVKEKKDLVVDKDVLELYHGKISFIIWRYVEDKRIAEGNISYYVDQNNVHWIKNPY